MTGEFKSRAQFIAFISALTVAGIAVVWNARLLILLLLAGGILAVFLQTVMARLQRWLRIPYGLAYVLTLGAGGVVLACFAWLRGPALIAQTNELRNLLPAAFTRITEHVQSTDWGSWIAAQIADEAQLSRLLSFLVSGIGGATVAAFSFLGGMALVMLVALYISAEPDFYRRALGFCFPAADRDKYDACVAGAVHNLRFWLLARALSMSLIGTIIGVGLWILGIPLAGTLGLMSALFTFVPNIGPALAGVPVLLIALTISPLKVILALIVICAAHFLEGNLITPLMDRGIVKLPPAMTLTLQCLLGSVTGLAGVALAAPLLAVILGAAHALGPRPTAVTQVGRVATGIGGSGLTAISRTSFRRFR